MRIISGSFKGRKLATPGDDRVRPTTDRVRESLFSIMGGDFSDCVVVDGFAGTGALGLEALSRGADHCYFFDRSHASIQLVEENVARVEAAERASIYKVSFEKGLELLDVEPDVFFLDPPYGSSLAQSGLNAMAECEWVTARALVVVEQSSTDTPVEHEDFELDDERHFGDTRIRFLLRR